MKRLPAVAALCIAAIAATTAPGPASELGAIVTQSASGGVTANFYTWYAFPMYFMFATIHEAEALDVVRRDLAAQRRIRDLPILIWGPPRDRRGNRIAIEPDCEASYTPNSAVPEGRPYAYPLGTCYEVTVREIIVRGPPAAAYRDKLAMVTALSELSAAIRAVEIADLPAFLEARRTRLEAHRGLVLHFDPRWSPDGARLLYTVWEDGAIRFELLEASTGAVTRLEPLEDYMAAQPIWSRDSRFVAYAGSIMVKIHDIRTGTTRTFRAAGGQGTRARTMIEFEGPLLRFAFDVNFLGGTEAYTYDTARGTLTPLAGWVRPFGDDAFDWDRHASLGPVRSPDGRRIALFTFVNGQRRVIVERLH